MKRFSFISALVLLSSFTLAAQKLADRPLVITGSVLSIKTKCFDGKPAMSVGLFIQFRNDGEVPLLLIRPTFLFTTKVNFISNEPGNPVDKIVSADLLRYNPYLENPYGPASRDDYDPFPSFVKKLDVPEPPFILASGGYLEFHDTLWVKNGFRFDTGSDAMQKECEAKKAKPIPEYPSFNVEYHLSLKKYDRGTDLLKNLQNRWRRFGHLLLDSNGDVSFKSEPIVFGTS